MRLLHRTQRAWYCILVFPALLWMIYRFAPSSPLRIPLLQSSPSLLMIVVTLFMTHGFRWIYLGWGLTIRHAIVLSLPPELFVGAKTLTGFSLILTPNLITTAILGASSGYALDRCGQETLFGIYISIGALFLWNWIHLTLLRIQRQDILVFLLCLTVVLVMTGFFHIAFLMHPVIAVLLTASLAVHLVRYSLQTAPRRIVKVQYHLLEQLP